MGKTGVGRPKTQAEARQKGVEREIITQAIVEHVQEVEITKVDEKVQPNMPREVIQLSLMRNEESTPVEMLSELKKPPA
ncbi:unnamed protein product [Lathyrus sativus]|nr:unnamed protein product [Lathyrus sativus]